MSKTIVHLTERELRNMIKEAIVDNIIQINKNQLRNILSESRNRALDEINHREATDALCANMDANDELARGNDVGITKDGQVYSIFDKRRQTSEYIYKRLTQGVVDNVGSNFYLSFGREEPDGSTSEVEFYFTEVILLTEKRVVIQGNANMSRSDVPIGKKRPSTIQIDYHFDEQKFYEAVFCRNNTVRDKRPLSLDIAGIRGRNNIATAEKLIHFLTLCYYSMEDKKTDIANKPPMLGNPVIPFSHH